MYFIVNTATVVYCESIQQTLSLCNKYSQKHQMSLNAQLEIDPSVIMLQFHLAITFFIQSDIQYK